MKQEFSWSSQVFKTWSVAEEVLFRSDDVAVVSSSSSATAALDTLKVSSQPVYPVIQLLLSWVSLSNNLSE